MLSFINECDCVETWCVTTPEHRGSKHHSSSDVKNLRFKGSVRTGHVMSNIRIHCRITLNPVKHEFQHAGQSCASLSNLGTTGYHLVGSRHETQTVIRTNESRRVSKPDMRHSMHCHSIASHRVGACDLRAIPNESSILSCMILYVLYSLVCAAVLGGKCPQT